MSPDKARARAQAAQHEAGLHAAQYLGMAFRDLGYRLGWVTCRAPGCKAPAAPPGLFVDLCRGHQTMMVRWLR